MSRTTKQEQHGRRARCTMRTVASRGRRGITLTMFALMLPVILGFVALAVDTGNVALTKAKMQSAVDAAALAASQEIALSVETAADATGDGEIDTSTGVREMAKNVAALNDVYVHPQMDVVLGRRHYVEQSGEWEIEWGVQPYNAVKVVARRDQEDLSLPDGKIKMAFAWAIGHKSAAVTVHAIAFVKARDIVSVLDFSGSMNDDSEFKSFNRLGKMTVHRNQEDIFNILKSDHNFGRLPFSPKWFVASRSSYGRNVDITFRGNSAYVTCSHNINRIYIKHSDGSSRNYYNVNRRSKLVWGYNGKMIDQVWVRAPYYWSSYIKLYDNNANVKLFFGLNNIPWPWASGSWDSFINHCRHNAEVKKAGYKRMYGGASLVDYLLSSQYQYSQTDDLWKTPHYPFNAMKEGMTLFSNFLINLGFGDEVGLVSYATYAKWETNVSVPEDGTFVDVRSDPITANIAGIDAIQRHKQAGHYANMTAMGDGIKKAREMLLAHKRYGAQHVILLMTDGNANIAPDNWSTPGNWNWNTLTDFDGDGSADYTTGDRKKSYAFYQAKLAMDSDIVIHTLSVGANADHVLMEAIAKASGGTHIKVDLRGDYSLETLEQTVKEAYKKIAGKVPPPTLVMDPDVQ